MYKIGDKAWAASYGVKAVPKTCPVCYGNNQVTVVLGNGDQVLTPCDLCRGARTVTEYECCADARPVVVTEIRLVHTDEGDPCYRYNGGLSGADLFPTKEEAMVRALDLAVTRQEEEQTRAEHIKANKLKSYSWNVGYHLQAAAKCRADAERHEKLAVLCGRKGRSNKGGQNVVNRVNARGG